MTRHARRTGVWIAPGVLLLALAAPASSQVAPGAAAATPAAQRVLARADTLFARQDWAKAASAYEEASRHSPGMFRVWYRMGIAHAATERWDRAIDAYRRADATGGVPFLARYNMACAFARNGQRDSAFASLNLLADRGYRQPEQIEADTDFELLRSDAAFAAVVERARRNSTPCAYVAESRQFDFWIGEWDVFDNQRNQGRAGSSRVERILGQCVLLENWSGTLGGSGKSFNLWNSDKRCWQQTWVDDSGSVTYYSDSRIENGAIAFMAERTGADGRATRTRMTFFPLAPDQVRQLGETSTDGGNTWAVIFDLNYVRKR